MKNVAESLAMPSEGMTDDTSECRPRNNDSCRGNATVRPSPLPNDVANAFEREAAYAIATGDDAEVFNAALDFVRLAGVSPQTMGQAFAILARRAVVSRLVVRDWLRESTAALEAP
jgi:hypothetical protein